MALAGLAMLVVIVIAAIAAPIISPQNPYDLAQLDVLDSKLPPGERSSSTDKTYWLGTDDQGRDMLSGIFYGLRISLAVVLEHGHRTCDRPCDGPRGRVFRRLRMRSSCA